MINSILGVCGQYIKICQKVTKTLLTFTPKWFITNHYRAQETSHTISLLQGLVLSSLLKRSLLDNTQKPALYVRKINVITFFFLSLKVFILFLKVSYQFALSDTKAVLFLEIYHLSNSLNLNHFWCHLPHH